MKELTPILAIICITGLLAYAMILKIDGTILSLGLVALAGLGGYKVKGVIDKLRGGK